MSESWWERERKREEKSFLFSTWLTSQAVIALTFMCQSVDCVTTVSLCKFNVISPPSQLRSGLQFAETLRRKERNKCIREANRERGREQGEDPKRGEDQEARTWAPKTSADSEGLFARSSIGRIQPDTCRHSGSLPLSLIHTHMYHLQQQATTSKQPQWTARARCLFILSLSLSFFLLKLVTSHRCTPLVSQLSPLVTHVSNLLSFADRKSRNVLFKCTLNELCDIWPPMETPSLLCLAFLHIPTSPSLEPSLAFNFYSLTLMQGLNQHSTCHEKNEQLLGGVKRTQSVLSVSECECVCVCVFETGDVCWLLLLPLPYMRWSSLVLAKFSPLVQGLTLLDLRADLFDPFLSVCSIFCSFIHPLSPLWSVFLFALAFSVSISHCAKLLPIRDKCLCQFDLFSPFPLVVPLFLFRSFAISFLSTKRNTLLDCWIASKSTKSPPFLTPFLGPSSTGSYSFDDDSWHSTSKTHTLLLGSGQDKGHLKKSPHLTEDNWNNKELKKTKATFTSGNWTILLYLCVCVSFPLFFSFTYYRDNCQQ